MKRNEILDAATQCVMVDRNVSHGEPEDNFRTIAEYWTTYLESLGILKVGKCLESSDVGALMVLQKIARIAASPERPDHWIDMAGYSACGGELATKESSL